MKELEIVKFWLEEVIIGLNLCPYAKAPYENGLIDIRLCHLVAEEKRTHFVFDAMEPLLLHPEAEYSVVVAFPKNLETFLDFNDWVMFLNDLLKNQKLDHLVQLIAFHPGFQFAGTQESDRANLVNSSPYPTIHILKNIAIENLNLGPIDGEKISKMNEKKLSSLSLDRLRELYFWRK